jgi:hypothetical protein
MITVAALLVVSISLAVVPRAPVIADHVGVAICKVLAIADGRSCAPAINSPTDHIPPQPCVTGTQTGSYGAELSVLVVKGSDNRMYEIAKLSDGRYRVTLLQQSNVGLEVGVGAGVTLTVEDNTVGGSATADASASLGLQAGQTWYVDSQSAAQDLINYQLENTVKDYTIGGGPLRSLVDWGEKELGLGYQPPEPDETTVAGGMVLDASAEATDLVDHAGASVGATAMLGVRTSKSGDTTVYLSTKVEGEAGLQALGIDTSGMPQFQGAAGKGSLQLVTAVTFDSSGNMSQVTTTAVAAGETKGLVNGLFGNGDPALSNSSSGAQVYTATLPIHSESDRNLAAAYLAATGASQLGGPLIQAAAAVPSVYATTDYLNAVRARGFLTQQTYSTENTTDAAAEASGKLGIELGGGFHVDHGSSEIDDAQYWDGMSWQKWEPCG